MSRPCLVCLLGELLQKSWVDSKLNILIPFLNSPFQITYGLCRSIKLGIWRKFPQDRGRLDYLASRGFHLPIEGQNLCNGIFVPGVCCVDKELLSKSGYILGYHTPANIVSEVLQCPLISFVLNGFIARSIADLSPFRV